jgi:hypothetical protein
MFVCPALQPHKGSSVTSATGWGCGSLPARSPSCSTPSARPTSARSPSRSRPAAACREEVVGVTPADVVGGPTGEVALRAREDVAKFAHDREVPVPEPLAARIDALGDVRDRDEPVVDRTGTTVYRWVTSAGEYLAQKHDDSWRNLDVHDLRRTRGTNLPEEDVLPPVVMDWGGWRSWEPVRRHYLGEFSPRALGRGRGKVDFLEGDVDRNDDRAGGRHPAVGVSVPTRGHLRAQSVTTSSPLTS